MTKPRITAAMLRKRPKASDEAEGKAESTKPVAMDAEPTLPMQSGSIADHPSFRAPQFGIRPKRDMVQPSIHVQRAARRSVDNA